MLESTKHKTLYKGCTNDLKKRFKEHNGGLVEATKLKRPWKLIYYEACLNKTDAYNREKYLKMAGVEDLQKND
ncbi:MAG: GIY-YIG nuclease family protein [Patescibacteria group bacterium]